MTMFEKLRNRSGKQFVQNYNTGGPIEPGTTVGQMATGKDNQTYVWNGMFWESVSDTQLGLMATNKSMIGNAGNSSTVPTTPKPADKPGGVWLWDEDEWYWSSDNTEGVQTPEEARARLLEVKQSIGTTQNPLSTTTVQTPQVTTTGTQTKGSQFTSTDPTDLKLVAKGFNAAKKGEDTTSLTGDAAKGATMASNMEDNVEAHARQVEKQQRRAEFTEGFGGTADGTIGSAVSNFASGNWKTGVVDMAVAGMKAVDNLAMGDKNFGAQSEAIDSAVHGVSGALMKSGNPYAMAAGAALEGANFLTKAGGQTVQGFDVDINSSGYGQMGHKASSSSRDFGAMIGLGGIFNQGKMQAKLAKRNQEAQMAMNAANIANEQAFEQEARANSIQNTIMNNQMALAGGLDTSLLGG